ncbi:MAG: hypothetical protein ABI416_15000 [Ginsengibacter sp.]
MKLDLAPRGLFTVSMLLGTLIAVAQTATPKGHIDPSRPTNQYTRLSNNLECNFLKSGQKTYGYRANFVWASGRQHHSMYMELPLLYATSSKKFGIGDTRFRYYWVPYKNYIKKPGAFGFAIDTYVPTGNIDNGLGRGRWIVATGLSTALVFGRFSTFPYIYYLYSSEVMSDKIPAAGKKALHGYIVQSICVYKIDKNSYIDCTPIFMKNSYSNAGKDDFVVEGNYLYMVKQNKIQVGCFARRYFLGNSTTIRAAMRIYF